MESIFTEGEVAYLTSQLLGRLATSQPDGTLQASPVGFAFNSELQTFDISGLDMARSRKFRNVQANGRAAFVVDDVVSVQPWVVRCLEIRGRGEAINEPTDSAARMPGPIIRIFPERIISWGIDPPEIARGKRDV